MYPWFRMCFKRLPHPSQLNIPVSLPVKGRVVCLQQEVSKSLGLLAAAHSVCFHRPRVLRRKNSGMPSPPADPSASHTCPVSGNRPFFFFQIELSGYQTLVLSSSFVWKPFLLWNYQAITCGICWGQISLSGENLGIRIVTDCHRWCSTAV